MKMNKAVFGLASGLFLLSSCMKGPDKKESLPVLGAEEIINENNEVDTIYRKIDHFKFIDQDSNWVDASTFSNNVYVVDFFFTSCPSICPKMTKQMARVYEEFEDNSNVMFLSHSIDPKHDDVPRLKAYADKLGVNSDKWHFVRGEQDVIYDIAEDYMVSAAEDESAPGGYIHSGAFVLMDGQHRIRGYYDGVLPEDVDQLMQDINVLLKEEN